MSFFLVLGMFIPLAAVFAGAVEPAIPNEAEDKEEILHIGKEADMFADLLCDSFFGISYYENMGIPLGKFYSEEKEFGVKKGYMNETVREKIEVSVELLNGEKITREYYPYADSMNSYEAWEKEVKTYFLTDFLQLVAPNAFNQQKQFTSRTKLPQ